MEELQSLIQSEPETLISTLDNYQIEIIDQFLAKTSTDYLVSADMWLNASPSNTAQFGGDLNKSKIYREKILDELEKFLCGNENYHEDRKKISESADKSQQYLIGVLSAAIGKTLGVAGTFVAPVVVLLLVSFSKMALNAWCEMRKETRQ